VNVSRLTQGDDFRDMVKHIERNDQLFEMRMMLVMLVDEQE